MFSENIDYLKRERGKKKRTLSTKKRNERRRKIARDLDKNITEARKKHIKNLSDYKMTRDQINVLSRGLKFIPTPVTNTGHVRAELLKDFNAFARRMRLQYIFHGKDKEQHPFHVKSDWEPPVQPSVQPLETYLEEAKLQLANINTITPRTIYPGGTNLPSNQYNKTRQSTLHEQIKALLLLFSKEDKKKEGQIQLDDRENYKPLETPMVVETSRRVKKLIDKLYKEKHIDEMTRRWLSLTPNPPRIPQF